MVIYCGNKIVADKVSAADNFKKRFWGLMGKKSISPSEGLLLLNCPSIHCFFMKFPIDAVYLSVNMAVLDLETITPGHIGKRVKNAAHVLELPGGSASDKIKKGDFLEIGR